MEVVEQVKILKRGAVEIISEEELLARLYCSKKTNTPLKVKAGFDPTAPDIHLGHTVLLRKLRHFQDSGHKVIFLIGDATALVGDPSGQSKTRKTMTWEEVEANTKTYIEQVSKILKTDKTIFEYRYNHEWFSSRHGREKNENLISKMKRGTRLEHNEFTFEMFVDLAQKYTVARLLERDDFQKRMKDNKPISFLELFYPLMQGYDSVKLKADVEIGGSDQKFNMLVGRDLQQSYGQKPQIVITMPLLEGTDGVNKMSKSLGNYIGINEPPKDMFGKIMSISDELMYRYYELLTDEDLELVKKSHPKEAKLKLASLLVETFHGSNVASRTQQEFNAVFRDKQPPHDLPLQRIMIQEEGLPLLNLIDFGVELLYTNNTKNEWRRLINQGAVKVDGQKVTTPVFKLCAGKEYVIQIAQRSFIRVAIDRIP